jgi:DNA-binding MarR family transcriptional regulator
MTTPWLTEREARAWRGLHRMRVSLFGRLHRELLVSSNLTAAEFEILVVVSESPDHRIRSRDLCLALDWERSRLSHQLARMEERGSVTRAPCATDARGFDVVLTPSGLAAIEAAAPLNLATVRHCFVDLLSDDELDMLASIAERVVDHIETHH